MRPDSDSRENMGGAGQRKGAARSVFERGSEAGLNRPGRMGSGIWRKAVYAGLLGRNQAKPVLAVRCLGDFFNV